ncbi:hypothetical protein QQS21_002818 [Conoideocrella luteorostrata]|uniref:Fungal calcium binding protein domain-containing protein n=1 Tax=Conoideocrella luteorostrata TaxID=1105319 RepID=A0AAJ0CYG0_9HYPO|nr:hypothetical protein QQS21_002818 [Conoideocrella luteorostrata]
MQFTLVSIIAFAAMALAAPAEHSLHIHLPPGCSRKDAGQCALRLVGTTASCSAAVLEGGANIIADLSCIASAAGTARHIDLCKKCIHHKTKVHEKI